MFTLVWIYKQICRVNCRNYFCKTVKYSLFKLGWFSLYLPSETHTHPPIPLHTSTHVPTHIYGVLETLLTDSLDQSFFSPQCRRLVITSLLQKIQFHWKKHTPVCKFETKAIKMHYMNIHIKLPCL